MRTARLVGDGSSDAVLVHPLRWLLGTLTADRFDLRVVDLRHRPSRPRTVVERVDAAFAEGTVDLLFVHRDAEAQDPQLRHDEVAAALGGRSGVAVVPVRMTESWLLHDEAAIRTAAERPAGREALALPKLQDVESRPDPKALLFAAIEAARGQVPARRRRQFNVREAVHRVAELIDDWSPLRPLPAFRRLEADTRTALATLGVPLHPNET